jgi:aspartyl-tRNA(Asn)/glutamyl-tRNA(Gln) amidotransferase subunit C
VRLCFGKSYYGAKQKSDYLLKISHIPIYLPASPHVYFLQMADLSRDDVLKLAQLARLDLTDDEVEEYTRELSEILQYVEKLQAVDVDGLAPTNQVTGLTNVTRTDEVKDYGYDPKDLLKNVPAVEADQIKVRRMIG